ncbi:hypothetical protein FDUTEX481_02603, partial [Tolypothrix sp. PCC 7601]
PRGRGAGGEGETLHKSGFHFKLTPMGTALLLQSVAFFCQIGITPQLPLTLLPLTDNGATLSLNSKALKVQLEASCIRFALLCID